MPPTEAAESGEFVLAFKTLKTLGYREGPVEAAIDEVRTDVGSATRTSRRSSAPRYPD